MGCENATKLQEYLDGQLSPGDMQAVKGHLAACATCQEEWALLRQVDKAMATVPLLEEPAGFTARVMAQVSDTPRLGPEQTPPVSLPPFRLRWEDAVVSFAFAGVVMTTLLAFSLLQFQVPEILAFLHRTWWTLLPELDRLWHTIQMEPAYAVWGLSSLCVATVVAASAIVLWQQWTERPASRLHRSNIQGSLLRRRPFLQRGPGR
jgi:hypothetical protein